jgi:hypothetical protein
MNVEPFWTEHSPIGVNELENDAAKLCAPGIPGSLIQGDRIRCCVRGCEHWLSKRRRGPEAADTFCPEHGISVSSSPTYVYQDYRDNFVIDVSKLEQVKKLKVESWRLGNERSEDAVSWNVFVSLAALNGLSSVLHHLTGLKIEAEPELYLWGVKITDQAPQRWDRLVQVRQMLEEGGGIPTEPDIILRVPGVAIVLIEAKFGSPNGTMLGNEDRFGLVHEFLDRYPSVRGEPDPLNREQIESLPAGQVLQQLVRNVVFAQWLAEKGEVPYVVNLVCEKSEQDIEQRFGTHLAADSPVKFRRVTWEELYGLPVVATDRADRLKCYMQNKTSGLRKAFAV